jgi:hypothetical protein
LGAVNMVCYETSSCPHDETPPINNMNHGWNLENQKYPMTFKLNQTYLAKTAKESNKE